MGAGGRDFHNFNSYFKDNKGYDVVAFTAAQIPNIEGRIYPPELAGKLYPRGIPILHENELKNLIQEKNVDICVFAYSDVSYDYVMHQASLINSIGADFLLMGTKHIMLKPKIPVIAVCSVRTGCGKSQTIRRVSQILKKKNRRIVSIRHPMPYGNLIKQNVQRFEKYEDLERQQCTIEEREEYEPHLEIGNIVYAGIDYCSILKQAEKEADIILWDGGNNDTPFYEPELLIVVVDPHRPGHELSYYPGEINFRNADVIVINKMDTASKEGIEKVRKNIRTINPEAVLIEAYSPLFVKDPSLIQGKRVLVIEDGPTLTHGGMSFGAGYVGAERYGAKEIVDPRSWITGSIVETFNRYPGIGKLLPAMGYGKEQIQDLEKTIDAVDCDTVIIGTPVDLTKIIKIKKPVVRVQYQLQETGKPDLEDVLNNY
jgi:predicted GTPase